MIRTLAACCLAAAATSAIAQTPKPGGTIRVSINSDIRSTNAGVQRDANSDVVTMHVVEGLVAYKEDGTPAPMLAEAVDVSKDGKTYTFKLRNGVKFHNGAVMTSADVAWSWKRWIDPATNWLCKPDFDGSKSVKVESVETPDASTVVFKLNKPSALFLTDMAALHCGSTAILHKDSLNADGTWKSPVATGPFRMGEWKRGEYIEIDAFREYSARPGQRDGYIGNKTPYADKVRWIVIKDDAAARAALQKGQIDILPGLSAQELGEMGPQPNLTVKSSPTMGVYGILFQTKDPAVANVKLRQAIGYTLDIKQIADLSTGNTGLPTPSVVPAPSSYHSAAQKVGYGVDIEKAKKLAAEAGYKGEPLKMITNRRYPTMYDMSVMVQSMAKKAGINIELEVLDWATQLDRYQKGNYVMQSFGYSGRADPSLSFEAMLGDKVKSPRKVWDNPRAIALNDEATLTGDRARRQAIFDEMHKLMLEDAPMIVLVNPGDANAISKKIEGFAAWPLSRERLFNVWRSGN